MKPMQFLRKLGPGLVTGASDDDPSGIGTYSQVGAKFGFNILWSMWFSYPLMVSIQLISARLGRVTGKGIAGNVRKYYPNWLLYLMVGLLLIANTINIGANLGIMGAALELVIGGPTFFYIFFFGLISAVLQVFVPYRRYVGILKWLTLSLFAYVAVVFLVDMPWHEVARRTFAPRMTWDAAYITAVVAVLGTTISPYLFFWQASQEVEEQDAHPKERPLKDAPHQATAQLEKVKEDTFLGMAISNIVAFFIILTAAVMLHLQGITHIESPAQAAEALRPVGGEFAFLLFSLGMVGTGLLSIPVLAGSAAYAVGEALKWPVGLDRKPLDAKGFYGVIVMATLIGITVNLLGINPIDALYWSAVVNGVVAVPVMIVMMLMTVDPKIMGDFVLGPRLKWLGWFTTGIMTTAVGAMFYFIGG